MRVAVVYNNEKKNAREFAEKLTSDFQDFQIDVIALDNIGFLTQKKYDLLITAGGDGTTLKTAFMLANEKTDALPAFLTVNFGRRGYLSSCKPEEFEFCFKSFLNKKHQVLRRYLARADIKEKGAFYFLNEISIIRHNDAQVIDIEVSASNCSYKTKGDGVIAATETGSTAYVYSAGGARLVGAPKDISVAFLAPEERLGPVVFGEVSQPIEIHCKSKSATLSFDGSALFKEGPFEVILEVSNKYINFITI